MHHATPLKISDLSRQWLAQCGLTVEQMENQLEPEHSPARKVHLYHCDHRGLPLALIDETGAIAWQAEYDEWVNLLAEDNPQDLQQLIRLPGQQVDEETGLYYNRHRYYDPQQGRYITQDPIGLRGGINLYTYPLNPIRYIDPLGLITFGGAFSKETGSAVNAASEGFMSYEDASAAIDAANGPTYSPLLFSVSADVGVSGYGILGGSFSGGVLTGNSDKGLDLCVYTMPCQGIGGGAASGISLSGTISNAPPSSGITILTGVTSDVGFIINGSATGLVEINDKNDPVNLSATLAGGVGGGAFSGGITCQQYTHCIVN